jgi:D-arabinose 1-dehydrogenase-like Zn-dependent alcohol dehydrogenase
MKAMLLTGYGGPEMLRYGDAPDPVPAPEEIVVDVHAASVNAADYKVRLGGRGYNLQFPHILGRDFSGVVAMTGEGVTDFAVGDSVFGVLAAGIEGAYAEKLAIKAAIVARKPDRLSHLQAAAMALTGITAIWAIEDTAQLRAGETILIQGGAGVSPVSRSNWRNTSVPPWSPPPAPPISTMYAHSEPTAWSTTTPRISPRSSPTATWCSTRSGVTFRHARIAC